MIIPVIRKTVVQITLFSRGVGGVRVLLDTDELHFEEISRQIVLGTGVNCRKKGT